MTQNKTSLPTHLLTAAKSTLCKSVVLSALALSSATAFAWNGDASVNAIGCNPLNNGCTFSVSDQAVQQSGSRFFDPLLLAKAVSPNKEVHDGVVVDFCLLRNAINTISPQFRHQVLEIMYLPMQIQDKNGYLNDSEFSGMLVALSKVW
ncbi:MAG: hypothetical protein K0R08_662 [Solimicrobium sp.]|jgi:hypothetical protein|nr:hypothetical protein [Solimicrobium sp.]